MTDPSINRCVHPTVDCWLSNNQLLIVGQSTVNCRTDCLSTVGPSTPKLLMVIQSTVDWRTHYTTKEEKVHKKVCSHSSSHFGFPRIRSVRWLSRPLLVSSLVPIVGNRTVNHLMVDSGPSRVGPGASALAAFVLFFQHFQRPTFMNPWLSKFSVILKRPTLVVMRPSLDRISFKRSRNQFVLN